MKTHILAGLIIACIILAAGCAGHNESVGKTVGETPKTVGGTPQSVGQATPEPVTVKAMEAVPDPTAAVDAEDPYAALNPNMIPIYAPDRDLYNALYRTVDTMQPGLDLSGYDLTRGEKYTTAECLYSEAGYGLFYLNRFKLSQDGNTVTFTYREDREAVRQDRETYYARLSHLLHNVAPEDYTDIQKLMAVYEYICENADYSGDMSDETTMAPYSILLKGQGICGGFANLTEYVLNRLGVTTRYVCNEPHAWDIVQLDGQWYHTDVTFGAGNYGDPQNSLHTFLMDDAARHTSLANANSDTGDIIEGFPRADAEAPPACTNTRYSRYGDITTGYAVDIAGGKVYFSDFDGIKRMNLDCTGPETLSDQYAWKMAYYDGVLYYLNGDGYLYQLTPGYEPVLIDVGDVCMYLAVKGTSLYYGQSYDGSDAKEIRLAPIRPEDVRDARILAETSVSRSRSFKMEIAFSVEMDTSADWDDYVCLMDGEGNAVPLHLLWSGDGRTLTVRPRDCVADRENLSLYILKGAPAASGAKLAETQKLKMTIVPDYVFPPAGE